MREEKVGLTVAAWAVAWCFLLIAVFGVAALMWQHTF